MTTIETDDFSRAFMPLKVAPSSRLEVCMPTTVHIMSVVGTAVPAPLRNRGLLACWYLVSNGEPISGPLLSLSDAKQQLQQTSLRA
jgi:hypothetical protein